MNISFHSTCLTAFQGSPLTSQFTNAQAHCVYNRHGALIKFHVTITLAKILVIHNVFPISTKICLKMLMAQDWI